MKKIVSMVLTMTMIVSMISVARAGEGEDVLDNSGDSASYVVSGKASATLSATYSVDVSWGAMEFTFKNTGAVWDPKEHRYEKSSIVDGKETYNGEQIVDWEISATKGDEITVVNHSDVGIIGTLEYVPDTGYEEVKGTFSMLSNMDSVSLDSTKTPNEFTLVTGIVLTELTASRFVGKLSLSGQPIVAIDATSRNVGAVTIIIR